LEIHRLIWKIQSDEMPRQKSQSERVRMNTHIDFKISVLFAVPHRFWYEEMKMQFSQQWEFL